jgi:hypothetical protein
MSLLDTYGDQQGMAGTPTRPADAAISPETHARDMEYLCRSPNTPRTAVERKRRRRGAEAIRQLPHVTSATRHEPHNERPAWKVGGSLTLTNHGIQQKSIECNADKCWRCSLSSPEWPNAHRPNTRMPSEKSKKSKDSQPEKQYFPTSRKSGHSPVFTILRLRQSARNHSGSSSIHGGNATSSIQKLPRRSPAIEALRNFDKSTSLTPNPPHITGYASPSILERIHPLRRPQSPDRLESPPHRL